MSSANPQNMKKDLDKLAEILDALHLTIVKLESEMEENGTGPWKGWPLLTEEAIGVWMEAMEDEVTDLQERAASNLRPRWNTWG